MTGIEARQVSHHEALVDVNAVPSIISTSGLVDHVPRPMAIAVTGRLLGQVLADTLYGHRLDTASLAFAHPANGKVLIYETRLMARHPASRLDVAEVVEADPKAKSPTVAIALVAIILGMIIEIAKVGIRPRLDASDRDETASSNDRAATSHLAATS